MPKTLCRRDALTELLVDFAAAQQQLLIEAGICSCVFFFCRLLSGKSESANVPSAQGRRADGRRLTGEMRGDIVWERVWECESGFFDKRERERERERERGREGEGIQSGASLLGEAQEPHPRRAQGRDRSLA